MDRLEEAIELMKKVEAACNELLNMVEPEITELKGRRDLAINIINGLTNFKISPDEDCRPIVEKNVEAIVNSKLRPVSCMGVRITIKRA